jgi:60S ribosome subunit biogenesis protein NIP7
LESQRCSEQLLAAPQKKVESFLQPRFRVVGRKNPQQYFFRPTIATITKNDKLQKSAKMRPLTEVETKTLFEKLANYTGRSLNQLIQPQTDSTGKEGERHVFRIQNSRVYYVRESLANLATSVARDNLLSLGVCVGKFTKTGKFRIHITALDVIAPHARYKVWIKPNGEMPFLYGGNIVKAHVGRWSEDCPEHQGVVVYSMNDTPLGFGVTAKSTVEARKMDPTGTVAFRQGDVGEYLREEATLFAT